MYSHYVVIAIILPFWFQRFFWKKHIFGPGVFLIFVLVFFFSAYIYIYILWDGLKLYFSVQHWNSTLRKSVDPASKHSNGCSKQIHPQLNSVHTNLLAFFFFLTLSQTGCRCGGCLLHSREIRADGVMRDMQKDREDMLECILPAVPNSAPSQWRENVHTVRRAAAATSLNSETLWGQLV